MKTDRKRKHVFFRKWKCHLMFSSVFCAEGVFWGCFRLLHFLFSCVRLSDICQGYLKLCVVIMVVYFSC